MLLKVLLLLSLVAEIKYAYSRCPQPAEGGNLFNCRNQCSVVNSKSSCGSNQLCCYNGCAKVCTAPCPPPTCPQCLPGQTKVFDVDEVTLCRKCVCY